MPTGFNIGPITIHFYGIIIMLGALMAAWLAEREARRKGLNGDIIWDVLFWLLIGGVIGARLWHIFTPPPSMVEQGLTTSYYLTHPLDAIDTRKGGLGIPGAVIGGVIVLYFYCRRKKLDFGVMADIGAPAVALGQAIGRWGNFINQEVYGMPTSLPWGIYIDPAHRLPEFANFERFHPLFLYESILNFANMGFLLWLGRRFQGRLKAGDLLLIYAILYPVERFLLEFLRLDASQVGGMNANQAVMAVIAAGSATWLYLRHRLGHKVEIDQTPST